MNFIETFILNAIYILFPLIVYLFYFAYNKAFEKEAQNVVLDFCLLTSFYLTSRFGVFSNIQISILIFNIPLLIAFLYKRNLSIFILSICIIGYYYQFYADFILLNLLEYIMYYFIYNKIIRKDKNDNLFIILFVSLKIVFTLLFIFLLKKNNLYLEIGFVNSFAYLMLFVVLNYFVIMLLRAGEKIVKIEI